MVFLLLIEDVCLIRRCIISGFFVNVAYLYYIGVYRIVRDDYEFYIYLIFVFIFIDLFKW